MAFPQGIYFRGTDNQTNPTDYDAEISNAVNYPRTSAQGNEVGWEVENEAMNHIDRSGTDPRLNGLAYWPEAGVNDYRIDLPATGDYKIGLALGDADNAHDVRCRVLD